MFVTIVPHCMVHLLEVTLEVTDDNVNTTYFQTGRLDRMQQILLKGSGWTIFWASKSTYRSSAWWGKLPTAACHVVLLALLSGSRGLGVPCVITGYHLYYHQWYNCPSQSASWSLPFCPALNCFLNRKTDGFPAQIVSLSENQLHMISCCDLIFDMHVLVLVANVRKQSNINKLPHPRFLK